MEFTSRNTLPPPKNLYPCLAIITIAPPTDTKTRRLSTSSSAAGDDDNVLKRIASGGRRKSEAGSERRKSFLGGQSGTAAVDPATAGSGLSNKDRGTWYWRVQAGVTDNALILLPLTQPANPLLTSAPIPLSQAMPAHAAHTTGHTHANEPGHDEGLVDKMKNLFRRGSAAPTHSEKAVPHPDTATTAQGDKVIDQTAQGEQLPTPGANAAGASNVNANAETGWPGVIDGEKLQAVAVAVNSIEKGKVSHGGGKKGEAYYVQVPVTSYFAAMTAGFSDGGHQVKSGSIRLEFDKDWIGAKAESELLHYHLSAAVADPRAPPSPTTYQIGSGAAGTGGVHPIQDHGHIAPDHNASAAVAGVESASVDSGRKVPGV